MQHRQTSPTEPDIRPTPASEPDTGPTATARQRRPRRRRLLVWAAVTLATTVGGFVVGGAATTSAAPARSSVELVAAPYAAVGPHDVGTTTLTTPADLPALLHWYPAAPVSDGAPVTYDQRLRVAGPFRGVSVGRVDGHAVADAPAAALPAPPLVVLSPGYGVAASSYAWLAEHLASHGFAVVAHEPEETLVSAMGDGLWHAAADRPAVLAATVGHLRDLARRGATWDADRVAVVGHSIGGHAALAVAGARLDADAFASRCDAGDEDAAWLCDVLSLHLDALAERAGVAGSALPPLAPSTEVAAVVALAGDAYLFDADGLAAMRVPVLAAGGLDDTGTPWSLGAGMTFASAGSDRRVVVGLEGAEHLVFTGRCDRVRRVTPLVPMDLCDDPDGDRATRHDVVAHTTTAFLLETLTGDAEAAASLEVAGELPLTVVETTGGPGSP